MVVELLAAGASKAGIRDFELSIRRSETISSEPRSMQEKPMKNGATPLHLASQSGHLPVVRPDEALERGLTACLWL